MSPLRPPAAVLAAFGAPLETDPLPGGQGRAWLAGDVILKPCGLPEEAAWVAEVLAALPETGEFRVCRPVRASDGSWTVAGWEAWHWLPGTPDPRRWDDVLAVSAAFHRAVAGLPRPAFLDRRDGPWTYGDRVAWEELPLAGSEVMAELLEPLAAARRPLDRPSQVVHADLLGNVLFAEGLPPAVIDWPVYFRPADWACAVVVADALVWYDAPAALVGRPPGASSGGAAAGGDADEEWRQLLVRALLFRIATNEGFRREGLPVRESADHYRRAVGLVLNKR